MILKYFFKKWTNKSKDAIINHVVLLFFSLNFVSYFVQTASNTSDIFLITSNKEDTRINKRGIIM